MISQDFVGRIWAQLGINQEIFMSIISAWFFGQKRLQITQKYNFNMTSPAQRAYQPSYLQITIPCCELTQNAQQSPKHLRRHPLSSRCGRDALSLSLDFLSSSRPPVNLTAGLEFRKGGSPGGGFTPWKRQITTPPLFLLNSWLLTHLLTNHSHPSTSQGSREARGVTEELNLGKRGRGAGKRPHRNRKTRCQHWGWTRKHKPSTYNHYFRVFQLLLSNFSAFHIISLLFYFVKKCH
jgi:hypothetical protein